MQLDLTDLLYFAMHAPAHPIGRRYHIEISAPKLCIWTMGAVAFWTMALIGSICTLML